jgi:hypothetical protein
MKVKQLSVFLENKVGHLADCVGLLSENDIGINAMALSDSEEFGVLHFLVDEPDKVYELFQKNGFGVGETEVMLVHLPDKAKFLDIILNTFKRNKINVEYMYMGKEGQYVFRLNNIEAALKAVKNAENSWLANENFSIKKTGNKIS